MHVNPGPRRSVRLRPGARRRRDAGPAVYLDNAATSYPKPPSVYRAVSAFMRMNGASAGRGGYRRAEDAGRALSGARQLVATLLGAPDPSRIAFTCNVTESLNLALRGSLRPGDRVVTTSMEHHAVWKTLHALRQGAGVGVQVVPCSPDGILDLAALSRVLGGAAMMVMVHASNVTGGIMPVEEVGRMCREHGVPLLLDAAQTAGIVPIDVEASGIDMLAFTGHKGLMGPQGTGGLYIRPGLSPEPLKYGGTGTHSLDDTPPPSPPDRYEAGTMNVPGIAGLGEAARFLLAQGIENVRRHEEALVRRLIDGLAEVPGVETHGPGDPRQMVGVVSFTVRGWKPSEAAETLDSLFGLMLRAGYHCAPSAHRTIGTIDGGTIRAAPGYFNTSDDVDYLLDAVRHLSAAPRIRA